MLGFKKPKKVVGNIKTQKTLIQLLLVDQKYYRGIHPIKKLEISLKFDYIKKTSHIFYSEYTLN